MRINELVGNVLLSLGRKISGRKISVFDETTIDTETLGALGQQLREASLSASAERRYFHYNLGEVNRLTNLAYVDASNKLYRSAILAALRQGADSAVIKVTQDESYKTDGGAFTIVGFRTDLRATATLYRRTQ